MPSNKKNTSARKKDHINLCLNEDVSFQKKSNGFDKYEFEHYAVTEADLTLIDVSTKFLGQKINYPFLISCMTGGTGEAEKINENLASAANKLGIPVGVGSQRQALENKSFHKSYKIIRENASNVPVLGNIGAGQVASGKNIVGQIQLLIDLVDADAMVIHINPLQELLQPEGDRSFKGLLKNIELLTSKIKIPFIAKEVGAGINYSAAKKLLDAGICGIDVAGAGGTSWSAVEMKRNNEIQNDKYFWDWGLPTTYCIKDVKKLKKKYNFDLIASGGINSGIEIAKAIALGADLAASARSILKAAMNDRINGVEKIIKSWFRDVTRIMFLTGCRNIKDLQKVKLIRTEDLY